MTDASIDIHLTDDSLTREQRIERINIENTNKAYEQLDNEDLSVEQILINLKSGQGWDFKVLSTKIPEFQRRTCRGWTDVPLIGEVSYNYPCMYKRTAHKTWFIRITYSGDRNTEDFENIVLDCAESSIKKGLPFFIAAQFEAGIAAIWASFQDCITANAIQELSNFSIGLHDKKTHDDWHKV